MALSDTRTKVVYEPDGVQTRYDIPFQLFDAQDVECVAVDQAGGQTRLTAFSVHGMHRESGPWVEFEEAPAAGLTLVLRRNTRPVHETEYPEGGGLSEPGGGAGPFPHHGHDSGTARDR